MADQEGVQAPPPPMTEAQFVEELLALFKRGEDAGLSTATIAVRAGFRRGTSWLDGVLASIETSIGAGKKG